jgi:hypothetical protein
LVASGQHNDAQRVWFRQRRSGRVDSLPSKCMGTIRRERALNPRSARIRSDPRQETHIGIHAEQAEINEATAHACCKNASTQFSHFAQLESTARRTLVYILSLEWNVQPK